MDLARFGLTSRPFRPTPDTNAYFASSTHESALNSLQHAFANQEGLALLDSEPGLGKTLIALKFLEDLPSDVPRLFIPSARFGRAADLFQSILFDYDAPYQGMTDHELRLAVMDLLLKRLSSEVPTVIVFDEAQHLTGELLEEIRLLGNLERRTTKAVFVVLIAQLSLRERLHHPDLEAFNQRIGVRCQLERLSADESVNYLTSQLTKAGSRSGDVITEEALTLCAQSCQGRPRLMNQVAHLALTMSDGAGERRVDTESVLEALTQLGVKTEELCEEMPIREVGQTMPANTDDNDSSHEDKLPGGSEIRPTRSKTTKRRSA